MFDTAPANCKQASKHPARVTTVRITRRIAALTVLTVALMRTSSAAPGVDRIDALLNGLAARSDLRFLREGKVYTAAEAARFLRAKLAAQGAGMTSAELFIQRMGSKSSSTGRVYMVLWPGGRKQSAADFLTEELARVDAARARHSVNE
jgi:hypothetical protein